MKKVIQKKLRSITVKERNITDNTVFKVDKSGIHLTKKSGIHQLYTRQEKYLSVPHDMLFAGVGEVCY